MRCISGEQCRLIDRLAITKYGFSSLVLMENAGRGVVDSLCQGVAATANATADQKIVILCGKGNNAGDGLVAARHLELRGIAATVVFVLPPTELRGDALANLDILQSTDIDLVDASRDVTAAALDRIGADATVLIDAMLGTGAQGIPRPPFDAAIRWFNSQAATKIAIDVPSGLNCDTGEAPGECIRADETFTFVARKIGFESKHARPFVGRVHVLNIGVPPSICRRILGEW